MTTRQGIFLKRWDSTKRKFIYKRIKSSDKTKLIIAHKGCEYAIYADPDGVLVLKSKGDTLTNMKFDVPAPNTLHIE